jgi:hypothetical protein
LGKGETELLELIIPLFNTAWLPNVLKNLIRTYKIDRPAKQNYESSLNLFFFFVFYELSNSVRGLDHLPNYLSVTFGSKDQIFVAVLSWLG